MTLVLALVDVGTTLENATGFGRYLLVFLLAMIPAIEPFIVIPVAIGLGLDPILTGIAAFAGSVTAVAAIVVAHQHITAWWRRRTGADPTNSSDRYSRARRIWKRYGLPGLAFAGPILAGIHLTALLATAVGSNNRVTIAWLTVGLAAWTVALVAGTVGGLSLLGVP
ncbi:small multi-drug export protein [Natronobacterium texcoconense]|uniref:Putative small multi-drug export protein n=1 Tax=Natronobacterium texcoconense TaxID=1095778 RepID=A0A1H1GX46_NATTX|nr:small multi-drug export protein [Natronobacterium texcoconense]SDR17709.1 Putative small multi-drug export protein [Natronobacterium texcoconense]